MGNHVSVALNAVALTMTASLGMHSEEAYGVSVQYTIPYHE